MKFKIAWMYYDLLELYGDRGNLKVLEYLLQINNLEYEIDKITINNEHKDISNYDLVFLGGGSDNNQQLIEADLKARKAQFMKVIKNQGFILSVCGGYQFFGQYYLDAHNNKLQGLGLFNYYTEAGTKRCVGNIKIQTKIKVNNEELQIVGFENHGGQTKAIEQEQALGEVLKGHGNTYQGKYEGYLTENFLGTYIHGPLLPKNPLLAKYIIEKILLQKYQIKKIIKVDFLDISKKAKEEVNY
ncbi:MAG: type 1 glutamine amidotransferase [Mycoplasmatales bacterium]